MCCVQILKAQSRGGMVLGSVTDSNGEVVIGATVKVKDNPKLGTITDLDGKYRIKINNPDKDVLVFSFIGKKSEEIPVKNRKRINVIMEDDTEILDEVVVVGYGTSKRKDLTGSVSSVRGDDIQDIPTSNVAEALMGRISGVHITQTEGGPNGSISVQVRGGMSITQSNEPLYVIDGIICDGGLDDIDPAEIESIDVLKDASSAAIYGARGANGVVVVTTKRGADNGGKMMVSFDAYWGMGNLSRKLDVMPVDEFVLSDYEREAYRGSNSVEGFQNRYGSFYEIDKNYSGYKGVDWQEEALGRTTTKQNYRLNISGGSKEFKYSLNYAYFKDLGAMIYSGSNKHTVSFNFSHRPQNSRFSFNGRLSYNQGKVDGMGTSEGDTRFNKLEHIIRYRPTMGIFGNDEDLLLKGDELNDSDNNPMQSPLISAREEKKLSLSRSLQMNGGLQIRLVKNLVFSSSVGTRYQLRRNEAFNGENSSSAKRSSINGSLKYQENLSFETSNVFNYNLKSGIHSVEFMIGQEFTSRWSKNMQSYADNFPNADIGLADMGLGNPTKITTNENYDDKMLSFFTRFNYNVDDKYLFSATFRADESSKFSRGNKWGYFPSASVAWRILKENFMNSVKNVFSDLKLRVGYGMTGNCSGSSYASLALLSPVKYSRDDATAIGYIPSRIANDNLRWEANITFNVGIDMGFFEQRLVILPEFYFNQSHDLLLDANLPASSGFNSMLCNIGKTQNIGIDLSIRSFNLKRKNFFWTTDVNFSYGKNKVKELAGEPYFYKEARFGLNTPTHKIEVGKPLGQFFGYKTIGLYQVDDFNYNPYTKEYSLKEGIPGRSNEAVLPGMWKYEDIDKNGVINENDRTVIGNANHKFFGGINNRFIIKNVDISAFVTFAYGGEVLNATKLLTTTVGERNYNSLNVVNSSKRWMTINSDGQIVSDPYELSEINKGKKIAAHYDLQKGDLRVNTWAIEDASYLRISNVTIGYSFPRNRLSKVGLSKLRLYVTGNNLFVWTPYSGYDPEVSTRRNAQMTPGVDYGAYPRSRNFVFGVNVGF